MQISFGGVKIKEYFKNENSAALRYNELALIHHEQFAVLNNIVFDQNFKSDFKQIQQQANCKLINLEQKKSHKNCKIKFTMAEFIENNNLNGQKLFNYKLGIWVNI